VTCSYFAPSFRLLRWVLALTALLGGTACNKPTSTTEGPAADKAPAATAESGPKVQPLTPAPPPTPSGPALKIAYSDWPGWVAWDIALNKGWFKDAGVPVEFTWFEYVPSMEAFTAGKVDAVAMTNGDQLVTGANGAQSIAIVLNDYSNGNDMVVAKPGIEKVADLKGKKVGVEVGFVSHLLLLNALKSAGLTEKDVKIVNIPTNDTPQALQKGGVDAIVAWQPNSGQALKLVPGSKAIFTSANVPGIIYDVLAVSPKSLAERRADWKKVVGVWFKVVDYLKDEKNRDDVLKIMSARAGLTPEEYAPIMKGTFFLDAAGNTEHFKSGDALTSVVFSNQVVDKFNMDNAVYKQSQEPTKYLDSQLVAELLSAGQAAKP
jgi:NitT/TauT family transport system substrate-binding protein